MIDVGTNNEKLLKSKLYMGLRQRRLEGKPFVDIMDEFVSAITQRYPRAVLQFEDFAIDRAQPLLERYRYDHLVFNDDIMCATAVRRNVRARASSRRMCASGAAAVYEYNQGESTGRP